MAGKKRSFRVEPRIASEYEEQKALVQWMDLKGILFYHIPNGGYRRISEAAKFKRMGVKPGVPDLCLPIPRGLSHGLYIEVKTRDGGNLSGQQKYWLEMLRKNGYTSAIANGCLEGIDIINKYLGF